MICTPLITTSAFFLFGRISKEYIYITNRIGYCILQLVFYVDPKLKNGQSPKETISVLLLKSEREMPSIARKDTLYE